MLQRWLQLANCRATIYRYGGYNLFGGGRSRSELFAVLATCRGLARQFWCGPSARRAGIITAAAVGFEVATVAMQFAINRWSRSFFDAVEQRSYDGILTAGATFLPLAFVATATVVGAVLYKLQLQIAWRKSVTNVLQVRWLSGRAFYRMNVLHGADIAPEHRMTEDVRMTVEPVIDLAIGFLSAVLTFLVFVGVLWSVGGSISVGGWQIPGFMVIAAILYSIGVAIIMHWIGAPFTQLVRERSEAEARFRFELTRVRENAESVALVGGEAGERRRLGYHYQGVVGSWSRVAWRWSRMTWVSHGNAVVAPILPLFLMTPKYLSGEVSLGIVMQAAAAFGSVQASAGWFTANYSRLSEWYASASRVSELVDLMAQAADDRSGRLIEVAESADENIHLINVSIELRDGRALVPEADFVIAPGEMVMVIGEAGTGKSSLIRAIAGLWPWGAGRILLPVNARLAFLPQRPYVPIGSLAAALAYPRPTNRYAPQQMAEALASCGLGYLGARLDDIQSWDKILSSGEQQRLGFARLILDPPTIAILDEATAALDETSQTMLMELFRFRLAATTVISVSHRPSLALFHNRRIELLRETDVTIVVVNPSKPTLLYKMRRAFVQLGNSL